MYVILFMRKIDILTFIVTTQPWNNYLKQKKNIWSLGDLHINPKQL